MNTLYRDLILTRVKDVVEQARALQAVEHRGLEGQLREMLIRRLFQPLLPSDIGAGTGKIVSAFGQISKQQDVVLFDKRILPPLLFEEPAGIFPVESVLYAIEVKSVLTSSELRKTHESAGQLLGLKYIAGIYDKNDEPVDHRIEPLIPAVFAFGTDLKSANKNEAARYDQLWGQGAPHITAICVVGAGYWWWSASKKEWRQISPRYEFSEVVGFISGVINTYGKIARSRKMPRLGRYLIDEP